MEKTNIWTGIEDLPDDIAKYRSPELTNLLPVWREVHHDLGQSSAFREFNERLARQWAIETGILERLYSVDRGTTQLLLEQGFDASVVAHNGSNLPAEQLVKFLTAHKDALEGLFAFVRGDRGLSTSYIRELHAALTQAQEFTEAIDGLGRLVAVPLLRGEWKRTPNNPTRSDGTTYLYCPPEHVASEMDMLVAMYEEHLRMRVAPEVNAAWLHHRFSQIHPFHDGNGRVARALATLEFLRAGLFPLVIDREQRVPYIDALERADRGDLTPLVDMFADIERHALIRALGLAGEAIQSARNVETSIRAFAADLKQSLKQPRHSAQMALFVAAELAETLVRRLAAVRLLLDAELQGTGMQVDVQRSTEETANWYRAQIIETARALDYYANLSAPRNWVRLHVRRVRADLVFSFHALGYEPRGAMSCVAFTNIALDRPSEDAPSWHSEPACSEPFTFSHASRPVDEEASFTRWIDQAVQIGLETIRRYRDAEQAPIP